MRVYTRDGFTPVDIQVLGITLLSVEEYKRYKENIPRSPFWWWLRSRYRNGLCYFVDRDGDTTLFAADNPNVGVRPALKVYKPNLKIKDEIILCGLTWTVISDDYILCDKIICNMRFSHMPYEMSNVKAWLEEWLGGGVQMNVSLKDRYDAMFSGLQFIEVWVNRNEFVAIETWVDENDYRWFKSGHDDCVDILDANSNMFVRTATEEEAKAVFEFVEEQLEAEEYLDIN